MLANTGAPFPRILPREGSTHVPHGASVYFQNINQLRVPREQRDDLKGRPRGWTLPVRDILLYNGAGFIVPVAGDIKLMPGTGSDPAFRRIDVDTATGKIHGLF